MKHTKNILISPLEWGLGHAARIIPIAKRLREMDHNVIIACGRSLLPFYRTELPETQLIVFPGFRPAYSSRLPQYLVLLLQTPLLLYHIAREHFALKKLIRIHDVDIVISDNRFGLWNRKTVTAYITHMPLIPFPRPFRSLESLGFALHSLVMARYTLCLIPDLPGELNLSGRLSHGFRMPRNVRYAGILSRFSGMSPAIKDKAGKVKGITVILSGPEPQKGILKDLLAGVLRDQPLPVAILGADPAGHYESAIFPNMTLYSHLPAAEMRELITSATMVICRSGYTTIMELAQLQCSALIIPTPGQTEQEYLAEYLSGKGFFSTITQDGIKASGSLPQHPASFPQDLSAGSEILLDKVLSELLEQKHDKA